MYKIIVDYTPSQDDHDVISDGLINTYQEIVGERDKPFSIFLKDDASKIFGGIQAAYDRESVYIELL